MTVITGILVFVCIWWLVLFCVLPWGVRAPAVPPAGHAPSAPERPRILRKMLITTAIAAVLFVLVYIVIDQDLIGFRR